MGKIRRCLRGKLNNRGWLKEWSLKWNKHFKKIKYSPNKDDHTLKRIFVRDCGRRVMLRAEGSSYFTFTNKLTKCSW